MISVGKKCCCANVLLPEPLGPMSTTRESLVILISMGIGWPLKRSSHESSSFLAALENRHLGRRAEFFIFRPDRQKPHFVSMLLGDTQSPSVKFLASPFEAVVGMPELAGRQRLPHHVVLAV